MQAILAEEYCSKQPPQPTPAAVHDFAWQAASQQSCQPDSGSELAAGLQNYAGEFNCFLNVIIQCLWYCSCFRTAVMAWPPSVYQVWHACVSTSGDCIWGLYLGSMSGKQGHLGTVFGDCIGELCLGFVSEKGIWGFLFASAGKVISGHCHDCHHNFICS